MKRRLLLLLLFFVTITTVALVVFALVEYGQTVAAAQAAARYTARISFSIFAVAFTASAFYRFFPGKFTESLLKNRRQIGLTFAYAHTVHLVALSVFISLSEAKPNPTRLAGGAFAYLLIFAMAATSNDWSVRKLGAKRWKLLHTVALYYLWFAFFLTYLPRLQGKIQGAGGSMAEFVVLMILVVTIMTARLAATFLPRQGTGNREQGTGDSEQSI